MQLHASCAARAGRGVLLIGPSGCGKSDLLLRLIDAGYALVADDQVELDEAGIARAPPRLAGLIEVRGLGIVRLPHLAEVSAALVVRLGPPTARLPEPARDEVTGLPMIALDPRDASAVSRVSLALACLDGSVPMLAGAFA